ncbi:MAG TPA: radical SAM protein [Candidatus Saccharimonadales bacterium]|jgi:radical SAM protein with 4Fe4S-binding SPASM domain|nr:radical SAM protein [Candidatus Saccharimonadales bacterium]
MLGMGPCWLVIGYDCNNRCRWCYASQELSSRKRMDRKTLLESIGFLDSLMVSNVVLIGGEPTVSKLLTLAVKEIADRDMEPTVVTNGRRMANRDYVKKLQDSGLRMLSISIESTSEEQHDWITQRPGSFADTVAGIQAAVECGMIVDTVTTISFDNLPDVDQMITWAKSLGIKSVGFNIETPNVDDPIPSLLTVRAAVCKMSELLNLADAEGIETHFAASIPLCLLPESLQEDQHFRGSCFVYYGTGLVIDTNGGIIPCVHWIGAEIDSIYGPNGVKAADEFLANWNDGPPKKFRKALWRYPAKNCIACRMWANNCTGGCPLLRLNRDLSQEIDPVLGLSEEVILR